MREISESSERKEDKRMTCKGDSAFEGEFVFYMKMEHNEDEQSIAEDGVRAGRNGQTMSDDSKFGDSHDMVDDP